MKDNVMDRGLQVTWSLWGITLFILMLSLGCTKQKPYDTAENDNSSAAAKRVPKTLLPSDVEYFYVPSSLQSTRTTAATFPMYMGDGKIVKLQFTETEMKVVEVDPEGQFANNPVNNKPVLTVPISHIDYRCAPDADGKCTHKEEEDLGKPWASRRFIKINAPELAVQEINFLPVVLSNLVKKCHEEVSTSLDNFSIDENGVSLGVEKSYKTNVECAGNIGEISDLTFRVVYQYSLVKLNSIVSPQYKSIVYTRKEESTFGFFDTETMKLDHDNNANETGKKVFLNRWNPAKKKVVYHLSENFNKPQYATIKAETIRAVANINHSLKAAGTELQIDLQDALPEMNPGDLRVNTIVMVEEPVNYGILGYGPTAANPKTGEIVHGRTAMYLGVMKTGIKRTYDDLVKERLAVGTQGLSHNGLKLAPQLVAQNSKRIEKIRSRWGAQPVEGQPSQPTRGVASVPRHEFKPIKDITKVEKHGRELKSNPLSMQYMLANLEDPRVTEQFLSLNCFYSEDFFSIDGAVEDEVKKIIDEVGAKPWANLSDSEKDKVVNTLLPFVWGPVLIHELGHNLGLRHNFGGSEDKDNFYTEDELKKMGAKRKFEYSSIMDYGYSTTNELQVMGKYDIAALRYGYSEQIELGDAEGKGTGQFASIDDFKKNPSMQIREYRFCTDEHVDVNPGCKRFDEGTSLTAIANHWVRMHEETYYRRNLRNGLESFSLMTDSTQAQKLRLIFDNLRTNFERYEDIKKNFGIADANPAWESNAFLKDVKDATKVAAKFYLKILQTPDTLCAVAPKTTPNTIIAVVPLRQISTRGISCFDEPNMNLNAQYVAVGQAGKSFQSVKDPNSDNPYADQIDVRGIWIDKLMALQALTGRLTGISTFDDYTDNFLDIADMKDEVQKSLSDLLLDEGVAEVTIATADGRPALTVELPVRLYSSDAHDNGHKILRPLDSSMGKRFGIPNMGIDFQAKAAQMLKGNLESLEQMNDPDSLLNSINVNWGLPAGADPDDYVSTNLGLRTIWVHNRAQIALQMVKNRFAQAILPQLSEEKVKEIKANLDAEKPAPEDASAIEKLAYGLGADVVGQFIDGDLQDRSYYEMMLNTL